MRRHLCIFKKKKPIKGWKHRSVSFPNHFAFKSTQFILGTTRRCKKTKYREEISTEKTNSGFRFHHSKRIRLHRSSDVTAILAVSTGVCMSVCTQHQWNDRHYTGVIFPLAWKKYLSVFIFTDDGDRKLQLELH